MAETEEDSDVLQDKCQNPKCLKNNIKLPLIKKISKKEKIAWEVKALPSYFDSVSKPSPIIEQLYSKRRYKHDSIILGIENNMRQMDKDMEDVIRQQCKTIKSYIQDVKKNVDQILGSITMENLEKRAINSFFDKTTKTINEINQNRVNKIDYFYENLKNLEQLRSDQYKAILKEAYKNLHEINYEMPYELQKFFQEKITYLNEITLNNFNCYTELQTKLKLEVESEMKNWVQQLKLKKEYFRGLPMPTRGSEVVNVPRVSTGDSLESITVSHAQSELTDDLEESSVEEEEEEEEEDIIEKIIQYKEKVLHGFENLQLMENQTLVVTKTLIPMMDKYLIEICDIGDKIIDTGLLTCMGHFEPEAETITTLAEHYEEEENLIRDLWTSAIEELVNQFVKNCDFFIGICYLWDPYTDRNEESKVIYYKELSLLLMKNDKQCYESDRKINIAIDNLRQAYPETKLQTYFAQITALLQSVSILCKNHCEEELAIIDKVPKVMEQSLKLCINETLCYLHHHPPDPESNPTIKRKRRSWMTLEELHNYDHILPQSVLQCQSNMLAVNNWQFGLWDTLRIFTEQCMSKQMELIEKWKKKQTTKMIQRCNIKISVSKFRFKSIKLDFYNLRMAEIQYHEERFEKHRNGIELGIKDVKIKLKEFEESCKSILDSRYSSASDIYVKLEQCLLRDELLKIIAELNELNMSTKHYLINYFSQQRNLLAYQLVRIKIAQEDYIKTFRQFSENGNYCWEEIKVFMKKCEALEKIIYNMANEFNKQFDLSEKRVFVKYETQIQKILDMMEKTKEEFNHNEEAVKKIKDFQEAVKREVYDTKYDLRKLNIKVNTFKNVSHQKLGDYDYLDVYLKCYETILEDTRMIRSKLEYVDFDNAAKNNFRVPIIIVPEKISVDIVNPSSMSIQSKKKGKKFAKRDETPIGLVNYSYILFKQEPIQNDSVMSKLNCSLYNSFLAIQEMARQFYQNHKVINPDRTQPTYEAFLQEVLSKYIYYQLQCEYCWIECVDEFSRLMRDFQNYLEIFYKENITNFINQRRKAFEKSFNSAKKKLQSEVTCLEDVYIAFHKKLKPLFGHPNNRKLMQELEEEMAEIEESTVHDVVVNIEPHKDVLKMECIEIEVLVFDMEDKLSQIKRCEEIDQMRESLNEQLYKKMTILENNLKSASKIVVAETINESTEITDEEPKEISEPRSVSIYTITDRDVKTRLLEFKKNVVIPKECGLSYSGFSGNLSEERRCSLIRDQIKIMVDKNYKLLADYHSELESFRQTCRNLHFHYKKMWREDIDKINELYSLKYDIPADFTGL